MVTQNAVDAGAKVTEKEWDALVASVYKIATKSMPDKESIQWVILLKNLLDNPVRFDDE